MNIEDGLKQADALAKKGWVFAAGVFCGGVLGAAVAAPSGQRLANAFGIANLELCAVAVVFELYVAVHLFNLVRNPPISTAFRDRYQRFCRRPGLSLSIHRKRFELI